MLDCGVRVDGLLVTGPVGAVLGTDSLVGAVELGCCLDCCLSEVCFGVSFDATAAYERVKLFEVKWFLAGSLESKEFS